MSSVSRAGAHGLHDGVDVGARLGGAGRGRQGREPSPPALVGPVEDLHALAAAFSVTTLAASRALSYVPDSPLGDAGHSDHVVPRLGERLVDREEVPTEGCEVTGRSADSLSRT